MAESKADSKAGSVKIFYEKGYAINKRVGAVINSANGFLLLGTSGAGAIRKKSQQLNKKEKMKYAQLLNSLPKSIKNDYLRVFKEHGWIPTYAQLGCLRLLVEWKGCEVKRGDAVLQMDWSKKDSRPILHAVGMSYKLRINDSSRLKATDATIRNSVTKALKIVDFLEKRSVALPLMCVRPAYGVGPERSLKAIREAIRAARLKNVKKIILCFDNDVSSRYLRSII